MMNIDEMKMRYMLMLRKQGVNNSRVLRAMEIIPREIFIQSNFLQHAYNDVALPIASGQTLSMPSIVGIMTQALEVNSRCKVLEIGTGTGHHAAVISRLCRRIYTIERHRNLARSATQNLKKLEIGNVIVIIGDGVLGLPNQAPFDRIILSAAAEDPPNILLSQLKIGGIMVLPVGQSNKIQTLIKITKTTAGVEYEELQQTRFVPLVEGIANS